jgi:hypothetical protein
LNVKDKEIQTAHEKINQATKELYLVRRKTNITEADKIIEIERKIVATDNKSKELVKEIKYLKRL